MIIFDSHLDLGWNAVNHNRDLTKSIAEIRKSEAASKEKEEGPIQYLFPKCGQAKSPSASRLFLLEPPRWANQWRIIEARRSLMPSPKPIALITGLWNPKGKCE